MAVLSRLEEGMPGRVPVLFLLAAALFAVFVQEAFALGGASYVTSKYEPGEFVLSASGKSAPLCVSSEDYWGVAHAVTDSAVRH